MADRGVGYGQLRYLHPQRDDLAALAQRNAPEILFNYLGRFSQDEAHWTPQRSQTSLPRRLRRGAGCAAGAVLRAGSEYLCRGAARRCLPGD
ncbi:hypothetical protein M8494_10505 [Serratia ureilytica]